MSIAAVALSAALLIVVASLFGGFIDAVEETGRDAFGDIYLNPNVRIADYQALIEQLETLPGVETAAVLIETYGLLHLEKGNVKAIRILGVDPAKYSKVTGFKDWLLNQKAAPNDPVFADPNHPGEPAGFVSIGILDTPDEQTDRYNLEQVNSWYGKSVVLTTATVIEREKVPGTYAVQQRLKARHLKFRITDIVFTGMYMRDSKDLYLPLKQVQQLVETNLPELKGPHEVFQIKLAAGVEPITMLSPIRQIWEKFARARNLPEQAISHPILDTSTAMQSYFVAELRKQLAVLILIFGVICSATVLLIACIFYMIVVTKQKDIAVIKSCGASNSAVVAIFLGFGGCVGIVGSCLGTVLGYIVTRNINTIEGWIRVLFGLKLWKSSIYAFEKIPNQVDWKAVGWVVISAVLAAVIGALIPAIIAAKTKPVEILRYE